MALSNTQQCLLEVQRIETRLIELKKLLRMTPDRGQRPIVHNEILAARRAISVAISKDKR